MKYFLFLIFIFLYNCTSVSYGVLREVYYYDDKSPEYKLNLKSSFTNSIFVGFDTKSHIEIIPYKFDISWIFNRYNINSGLNTSIVIEINHNNEFRPDDWYQETILIQLDTLNLGKTFFNNKNKRKFSYLDIINPFDAERYKAEEGYIEIKSIKKNEISGYMDILYKTQKNIKEIKYFKHKIRIYGYFKIPYKKLSDKNRLNSHNKTLNTEFATPVNSAGQAGIEFIW